MTESLADDFDLLLPSAADALLSDQARQRLRTAASAMPAIPRVAVECRLADGNDQVDLQQCYQRAAGDFVTLARVGAVLRDTFPEAGWAKGLACVGAALADGASDWADDIDEIFLEFDLPSVGAAPHAPALFFSLPDDPHYARGVARGVLETARQSSLPASLAASIERCFSACASGEYISSIGAMLSRDADVLRINVKGLRPARLTDFLRDCAWPGDTDAAVRLLDESVLQCDRVTVALDVGAALWPRIGLECFFDDQPQDDQRWIRCLHRLAAAGLCAVDKIEPFLTLPGEVVPPAAGRNWPAPLLRAALLRDEKTFTAFARRASHIKLSDTLGQQEAKAYFGAGHLWLNPRDDTQQWRPSLAAARRRRNVADLNATPRANALRRGISFLCEAQQQSDLWRDFRIGDAIADEWVTAFVATHLAATASGRAVAARAWQRLIRCQRAEGGWAYSRDYPPDADSTSWALRLAATLGVDQPRATALARAFLARHVNDGAITTYAEQAALAARIGLPPGASFAGWRQPHDCVTGAGAPFVAGAAEHLRCSQSGGAWRGYWWVHDAYPTALAVEALAAAPKPGDRARIAAAGAAARTWLKTVSEPDGATAFDVAFCLRIMLVADDRGAEFDRAVAWLIAQQLDDGSWASGARLRVPMPGTVATGTQTERRTIDQRRNFTTAAVIGSLALAEGAAE